MSFIRHIKRRFAGNYHKSELLYYDWLAGTFARMAKDAKDTKDTSPESRKFYARCAKEARAMQRQIRLGFWLGIPLVRKLYKPAFSRFEARLATLQKAFPDHKLVFNAVVMPMPLTVYDENSLINEYYNILFPYLFGKKDDPSGEGPYELDENVCLRPGDVVIDCGANIGLFSAVASAKGCHVHAFEPITYTRENCLNRTAALNPGITVAPYALSDRNGEILFWADAKNTCCAHEIDSEPDCADAPLERVQTLTLDAYVRENNLTRVDFIKADIEGAERKMLAGARETISRFSPKISICTYHLPDDPAVLRALILDAQPKYKIIEKCKKMYAWVE